jgi:repressor LexA
MMNEKANSPDKPYTRLQGQYLAFIYYSTKLNGRPPAEQDMENYFKTAYSSVHQMVLTLERKGFIFRAPGGPRSISLRLARAELPDLE